MLRRPEGTLAIVGAVPAVVGRSCRRRGRGRRGPGWAPCCAGCAPGRGRTTSAMMRPANSSWSSGTGPRSPKASTPAVAKKWVKLLSQRIEYAKTLSPASAARGDQNAAEEHHDGVSHATPVCSPIHLTHLSRLAQLTHCSRLSFLARHKGGKRDTYARADIRQCAVFKLFAFLCSKWAQAPNNIEHFLVPLVRRNLQPVT